MSDSLTAVQYGIGPIGGRIVESALEKGIEFIGAVDIDPEKVGSDLGTIAGLDYCLGVEVTDDTNQALGKNPDVVFHTTVSSIDSAAPQLIEILESGTDVISTTEEVAYPWRDHAATADKIDKAALTMGSTCLGTGINPGFVMDTLPAILSTPMASVESVRITRIQDAATRREPLQKKVGVGLDRTTFETKIAGGAGHVGGIESTAMVAEAMDWELEQIETAIEPILADTAFETDYIAVEPGDVAGINQTVEGIYNGAVLITLDLRLYAGAENPRDVVEFQGEPDIDIIVDGGYHGDIATAAVVTNVVGSVLAAESGLLSMLDIPVPSFNRHF